MKCSPGRNLSYWIQSYMTWYHVWAGPQTAMNTLYSIQSGPQAARVTLHKNTNVHKLDRDMVTRTNRQVLWLMLYSPDYLFLPLPLLLGDQGIPVSCFDLLNEAIWFIDMSLNQEATRQTFCWNGEFKKLVMGGFHFSGLFISHYIQYYFLSIPEANIYTTLALY